MVPKTAPAGNETRKVMTPSMTRLVKHVSARFRVSSVSISAPVKRLKACIMYGVVYKVYKYSLAVIYNSVLVEIKSTYIVP